MAVELLSYGYTALCFAVPKDFLTYSTYDLQFHRLYVDDGECVQKIISEKGAWMACKGIYFSVGLFAQLSKEMPEFVTNCYYRYTFILKILMWGRIKLKGRTGVGAGHWKDLHRPV